MTVTDNVTLNIDGILYLRINDPYLASYGVEDPEFAITQLAQTTMRYFEKLIYCTCYKLLIYIVVISCFK